MNRMNRKIIRYKMWEKISQYAINLSSHFISGTLISLVFCVRIQEYDQIYINIMQIE